MDYKLFYSHLQSNDVDTQRAAVFDGIISDDEFPVELKSKLIGWYKTLTTIKNTGDTMAKSFCVSFLRFILATPEERGKMKDMGRMIASLAPKQERG